MMSEIALDSDAYGQTPESDERRIWVDGINKHLFGGFACDFNQEDANLLAETVETGDDGKILEDEWVKVFCDSSAKDKLQKYIIPEKMWQEIKPQHIKWEEPNQDED